ncbi:lactate utilization protein [Desulfatitalea alkaliphila]|uniref:Lactate utilization protein n=1 Tax=Desulfatitalea alkaliphila TaxID=2929485 RepID=A0AA41R0U0_9BACT|nr:lactate utilization protein [Desulfatitalea alkaliphila]MCJ8499914.1 lactate utilization protein [Desulfatitalea alkaliphila]
MEPSFQEWLWSQKGHRCVDKLQKNGFDAHWVPDLEAARTLILPLIADCASFGFGGSETVRRLGLVEQLKAEGKTVFDHWQQDLAAEQSLAIRRSQLHCDCFFCSANAISLSGEIVNVDGVGNRTSAMGFGPGKVVIVAGMNKVTADLDSALRRVREEAGPMRAKSLNMPTPCAETGICTDCHVPQRICRITTILHRQPMLTPTTVVLINQALGY